MKKFIKRLVVSLSIATVPLWAFAQDSNNAYVASLSEQVRALQSQVNTLLNQLGNRTSQGVAQVYPLPPPPPSTDTSVELVIADDPGTTYRLGTPEKPWLMQSFWQTNTQYVNSVSFGLARKGNPTYPLTISLMYSGQTGFTSIASVTLTPQQVSQTSYSPTWITATFPTPALVSSARYYIRISGVGGNDINHYRWVVSDRNNLYPDGSFFIKDSMQQGVDALLKVQFGCAHSCSSTEANLSVSLSAASPTEKWVAAGSKDISSTILHFTNPTNEDVSLTKLRLRLFPGTLSDVQAITIWDATSNVMLRRVIPTNLSTEVIFPGGIGVLDFWVPKNSSKDMAMKVDFSPIGSGQPGTAGAIVGIEADGSVINGTQAYGLSSGNIINATILDLDPPDIRYFRSVPTVKQVALPVTSLTSGNHVLYKFKVIADPAYDVAIHKFTFSIATTGLIGFGTALPNFTLWNTTDNRRVSAPIGTSADFFGNVSNYDVFNSSLLLIRVYADNTDLPNGQCTNGQCWDIIPAGTSRTYELRGTITTDGSADSISTKLLGDISKPMLGTPGVYMDTAANISDQGYNFVWSDFSGDVTGTHSLTAHDWMNGYKVPGLLSTGLDASTLSN